MWDGFAYLLRLLKRKPTRLAHKQHIKRRYICRNCSLKRVMASALTGQEDGSGGTGKEESMTNIWFRHSLHNEHRVRLLVGEIRTAFRTYEPFILHASETRVRVGSKEAAVFDRICEAQLGIFCLQSQGFTEEVDFEMKILYALKRPVYLIDATTLNISQTPTLKGGEN